MHRFNYGWKLVRLKYVLRPILDTDWQLSAEDWGVMSRCNRAAGFELQAQHCERLGQTQQDQRMADQIVHGRQVYEQQMQRSAQWAEMGILERMGHQPLSPEQIADNRRRYGVTGQ